MADSGLASDHVNYLVLRYLQESGFEDSAKSLYREWHRNDRFSDPESLPFAPVVKPQELVHIIQDGLFHDQMQATVAHCPRRFHFTSSDLEAAASSARAAPKPVSRRQSVYTSNDHDDFAIPPPKRVRQTHTSDVVTNGDAMDIDDKDEDEDRVSNASDLENAPSDSEPREELPAIEMKVAATQTDKQKRLKTSTLYWTLDKSLPITILHTLWNPTSESSPFLLTAGESLCRLYNLSSLDDEQSMESTDGFRMSADHVVTAATWHPAGQYFTCAIKGPSQMGSIVTGRTQLVDISLSGEYDTFDDKTDMITVALRYSSSGDTLFSASTDGSRTVLEARGLSAAASHPKRVTAHAIVEDNMIVDLVCISETAVAVCGKGLVSIWSLVSATPDGDGHELSLSQEFAHSVSDDVAFDKIRYHERYGIIVATASASGDICCLKSSGDTWLTGPSIKSPLSAGSITSTVILQPPTGDSSPAGRSLIAVAFETGEIAVYNLSADQCTERAILSIGPHEPPLALAWSPSATGETRLAAASDEAIKVWDIGSSLISEIVSWKAAPANWYQGDDNHLPDDEDAQTEPTLSWSVTGKELAFAVGRKVSCIRCFSSSAQD